MEEKSHIPYNQYYKPKNDPHSHLPEYLVWFLENRDNLKHTDYRQYYDKANAHK